MGEDGHRSAQQWRYRLHLMQIIEVSMVYNGLAVVLVYLLLGIRIAQIASRRGMT